MTDRARRRFIAAAVSVAIALVVVVWAVPTFGGRAFVEVRARVVPIAAEPVNGREIVLPDGSIAPTGRLRIEVEIVNRYALPVLIDFRGRAVRAALVDRDATGGNPVWQGFEDDPALEQVDESPDGSGAARVILLAPGTTPLPVADPGLTLDLGATTIDPGIYSLRVSAYGIDASPQLLSITATAGRG